MSLPALWSLNKQGLTDELETYGITAHPDWTTNEIREIVKEQRAERNVDSGTVPKGLARMTLDQLKEEARKCNVVLPERPTKGALAKMIRDAHRAPNDTIVPFGKYRGWAYAQAPVPYLEWAAAEATQETASDDLKRIARWWTDQKKEKTNKAKGAGLPENDPERNWKLAPPPGTAAAGSDEWQRVSPRTPSSRTSSPRRRKAGETEHDLIREELAALQERMAKLQQMASNLTSPRSTRRRRSRPRARGRPVGTRSRARPQGGAEREGDPSRPLLLRHFQGEEVQYSKASKGNSKGVACRAAGLPANR